eukprot:2431744-Amphidinium_carterae.1
MAMPHHSAAATTKEKHQAHSGDASTCISSTPTRKAGEIGIEGTCAGPICGDAFASHYSYHYGKV